MQYFAITAQGLEEIVAAELQKIGAENVAVSSRGVSFEGDTRIGCKACLWTRCANRILRTEASFDVETSEDLYEGVHHIPWEKHFSLQKTIAVFATLKEMTDAFHHSQYVALKTKDAIVDRFRDAFGSRPNVDTKAPDVVVHTHIEGKRCTISLDMGGDGLHKRGYRTVGGSAPLKETLAAGIVSLTEYKNGRPFFDIMCGSGTFAIEAALIGLNIAPGLLHPRFAFQNWRNFDRRLWDTLLREAKEQRLYKLDAPIYASDIDEKSVDRTVFNLEKAGLKHLIQTRRADIQEVEKIGENGIVLCNPPYGERLGETGNLEELYKRIGDTYKQKFSGYEGYIFTGNMELAKHVGLKTKKRIVLYNGPIESRLMMYELY